MLRDRSARDLGTIALCVLFILLGIWMIRQSMAMTALGSVFPRTIAAVMIVCSAILLVVRLFRAGSGEVVASGESWARRIGVIVTMAVWALTMPILGFFVTSLLGFLVLLAVAEYDSWTVRRTLVYCVTAVAVVGIFYLVFARLLLVPVPRGILF